MTSSACKRVVPRTRLAGSGAPRALLIAAVAVAAVVGANTRPARARQLDEYQSTRRAAPDQIGAWEGVTLPGLTCGRGARYKFYINPSDDPAAGILFLLNGGGACMKEGPAPAGVQGPARQLYCMDYGHFEDPLMNDLAVAGLPLYFQMLRRADEQNAFRNYTYVFVPYCTGDVHAGRMSEPYDYDPDPGARFDVVHRGGLNVTAVVEEVFRRYPGDVPVVLTGVSAGGFGAIFNFPQFVARWPRTTLLPIVGIAPPHPYSIMAREGKSIAERWGARALLPPYCNSDDCLSDTMRLLAAHAQQFSGRSEAQAARAGTAPAHWRPFGFLQGQQDATLAAYLEISKCEYQLGLRRGMLEHRPGNLRAYVPATDDHGFAISPDYKTPVGGVDLTTWFSAVALAESEGELPLDAVDPWLSCNEVALPRLLWGR